MFGLRKTKTDTLEELLDPQEVSKLLKCSLSWTYKAAEVGTLPCVRLSNGGKKQLLRFKKTDVWALIERHYET